MYMCVCVCVCVYIFILFYFFTRFPTWIFGHQLKLQISKIKWTNSHHLCKTTPTHFSSSWLSCLSKCHHILLPKWKTWKSFLLLLFLQHPISHQIMWILLSVFHFKLCMSAFYYQYINPKPSSSLSCGSLGSYPCYHFSGLSFLPVPSSNYTLCCFQKKLSQMQEGK